MSETELSNTKNMQIANGIYSGSIIKGTIKRHSYGAMHNNGAMYEGKWKNDALSHENLTNWN